MFISTTEFPFQAKISANVRATAVVLAQALAYGTVKLEVIKELVLEDDVRREAVMFAMFFAADEVNF